MSIAVDPIEGVLVTATQGTPCERLDRVVHQGQARRWGSCDAGGALRFNWRVVQAPLRLIDYVVVHELVHLRHPDHTPAFWAELGRVLPDYDRRRTELRKLGPRLTW